MSALDWQDQAACVGVRLDMFFPRPGRPIKHDIIPAKQHCAICPVQQQCLDWALTFEGDTTSHYRHGVFGGMTPGERARENQRRHTTDLEETA